MRRIAGPLWQCRDARHGLPSFYQTRLWQMIRLCLILIEPLAKALARASGLSVWDSFSAGAWPILSNTLSANLRANPATLSLSDSVLSDFA
ncbi:MAG: hypothetical protein GY874_04765 [Desulfobacteraceae bacterium]|nr:hypothetical protein [Desulfobacteraceae bacterium]